MNIMDIWRLWENHQREHHQTQSVILVVHLVMHTQFMGICSISTNGGSHNII